MAGQGYLTQGNAFATLRFLASSNPSWPPAFNDIPANWLWRSNLAALRRR